MPGKAFGKRFLFFVIGLTSIIGLVAKAQNPDKKSATPGSGNKTIYWEGDITTTITNTAPHTIQLISKTTYHVRLREGVRSETKVGKVVVYGTEIRLINEGSKVEGDWDEKDNGQHGMGYSGSFKNSGSGSASVSGPGSNAGSVGYIKLNPNGERWQYRFEMWPDTDSSHFPTTRHYYQGDPPKELVDESKGTFMSARTSGDSTGFSSLDDFTAPCQLMEGEFTIKTPDGSNITKTTWKLQLETCNTFNNRIKNILQNEGGFVNDPNDRGGATNLGITWNTWKNTAKPILGIDPTLENLKKLTPDQAARIYKKNYWDEINLDQLCDGDMKYFMFDFYVNAGPNAIKVLQNTLNQLGATVHVNGRVDAQTINAINAAKSKDLYNTYKVNRQNFYNNIVDGNPSQGVFLAGWTKRNNSFKNKSADQSTDANCF